MPKDISSSSSSEDEDSSSDTPTNQQIPEKTSTTKYQCPADFVTLCHKPCSSTLKNNLKNNELWLIKAPSNFNPQSFSSVQLPLCGLQTVSAPSVDGTQNTYSVLASSCCSPDFRLLSTNQNSSHITLTSPFSGLINICENHGDNITTQIPQVIPAAPPPTLPAGLKQRFLPGFQQVGSTHSGEEERDEGSRKRKKHKKIKTEPQDEGTRMAPGGLLLEHVKTELPMNSEGSEEKRKKKRKKKDRERPVPADCVVTVKTEEVTVKSEPIDTVFGGEVEGQKKKKKKKRSKSDD